MIQMISGGEDNWMEKIFEAEFTLEETITTGTYTTITTLDTGLKEGDLEIGELVLAEIRMLEDLDTSEENSVYRRQLTRYEFLQLQGGYYGTAYYSQNPTYLYNPSTDAYSADAYGSGNGIFIYNTGRYLRSIIMAGRMNGSSSAYPLAGRYQVILYKTGIDIKKDYRA